MSSVADKEALGDWNNLKGTRYHLVYALWLLLRGLAREIHFYAGNDLLANPVLPPVPNPGGNETVLAKAKTADSHTDVWVQLKARRTSWTVSALLEENLLFNFICNEAVSEQAGRQ